MMGLLLTAGALAYAGFAALCLATDRARRQVRFARAAPPAVLRCAGWALLAASAVPPLLASHAAVAIVAWCGVLTLAAVPLTLGLAYAPRLVTLAGPGGALLAALLAG